MKSFKKFVTVFVWCVTIATASPAYSFLGVFGDNSIDLVKNGTLSFDTSATIGNALDGNQYLSNGEWSTIEDNQKRKYVIYVADLSIKDPVQSLYFSNSNNKIQFVAEFIITAENFKFNSTYLLLNGEYLPSAGPYSTLNDSGRDLMEIYANKFPYKNITTSIYERFKVVDDIRTLTGNFNIPFYQKSVNSDRFLNEKTSYSILNGNDYWVKNGYDSSKTYFKIESISYDSITLASSFFIKERNGDVFIKNIDTIKVPISELYILSMDNYSIHIKVNDNLTFIIDKDLDRNKFLMANVTFNETDNDKTYYSHMNFFVCDELSKNRPELKYFSFPGIFFGPSESNKEGIFLKDDGTIDVLSYQYFKGQLPNKKNDVGERFNIETLNDNLMKMSPLNIEEKLTKLEGDILELNDKAKTILFQTTNGEQYQIVVDFLDMVLNPEYGVRFIEGKGFVQTGFDGRILDNVWKITGHPKWYYDSHSNDVKFVNVATDLRSALRSSRTKEPEVNNFLKLGEEISATQMIREMSSKKNNSNEDQSEKTSLDIKTGPYMYKEDGLSGDLFLGESEDSIFVSLSTVEISSMSICEFEGPCLENNEQLVCSGTEPERSISIKKHNDSILLIANSEMFCGFGARYDGIYEPCIDKKIGPISIYGKLKSIVRDLEFGPYIVIMQEDGTESDLPVTEDYFQYEEYIEKNVQIEYTVDQHYDNVENFCRQSKLVTKLEQIDM